MSSLCLALAGCGSTPKPQKKVKFSEAKYGVAASPRMVDAGKPVPRGGGRSMVGKPYKVAGKWYHPKHDPNYRSEGLASWYGPTFHGRQTANGEIFDRASMTAAHTTMPLPSYARVTNTKNGRSMVVRVNDRGPFHGNRTIDLSERVATMLDFKHEGVARVKVEYVGPAPLHGQDDSFLMASYRGPGAVEPGLTMPGTMLAEAAPIGPLGPSGVPRSRPYGPLIASSGSPAPIVTAAFDPAIAFEAGASSVRVASLGGTFQPQVAPATALGYGGAPVFAAPPASLGDPSTFARGPALSSYTASARIEAAYSMFDQVGGSTRLAELARRTR